MSESGREWIRGEGERVWEGVDQGRRRASQGGSGSGRGGQRATEGVSQGEEVSEPRREYVRGRLTCQGGIESADRVLIVSLISEATVVMSHTLLWNSLGTRCSRVTIFV